MANNRGSGVSGGKFHRKTGEPRTKSKWQSEGRVPEWRRGRSRRGRSDVRTPITLLSHASTASQWLNLFLCLPTFHNDPTKWLSMYIGYCILLTESVFRILRIIHIVRMVRRAWRCECVCARACRYMERFSINVSEKKEYKSPCRIYVLTVTMATCFCHRMFSIPSSI